MDQKLVSHTASISTKFYCKDCGWPVVDATCNDEFNNFKDASSWDWWFYCSNKGCKNHDGKGLWQDTPDWCEDVKGESSIVSSDHITLTTQRSTAGFSSDIIIPVVTVVPVISLKNKGEKDE